MKFGCNITTPPRRRLIDPQAYTPYLRYRADNVTGITTVTQLNDTSGNNRHAPAVGGAEGTLVANALNGKPGVSVTGGQRYQTPNLTLTTFTLFLVVKCSTNNTLLVEHGVNINLVFGTWLYTGALASTVWAPSGQNNKTKTAGVWGDNQFRIITQQFTGSIHELRAFGAADALSSAGTLPTSLSANGAMKYTIGARADGTVASTATFCELILYVGALTAAQRANVEAYLADYYRVKIIPETTQIVTIGDSITAAYNTGADAVTPMVLTNAENPHGTRAVSLAVAGNTIEQQYTAWIGCAYRANPATKLVTVMIGLNNIAARQSATMIYSGALKTLVDDILTSTPWAQVVLYTLTAAGDRWAVIYPGNPEYWPQIQAEWSALNTLIVANTQWAGRVTIATAPSTASDQDSNGILDATFDYGDKIHPKNNWRSTYYATDIRARAYNTGIILAP